MTTLGGSVHRIWLEVHLPNVGGGESLDYGSRKGEVNGVFVVGLLADLSEYGTAIRAKAER